MSVRFDKFTFFVSGNLCFTPTDLSYRYFEFWNETNEFVHMEWYGIDDYVFMLQNSIKNYEKRQIKPTHVGK